MKIFGIFCLFFFFTTNKLCSQLNLIVAVNVNIFLLPIDDWRIHSTADFLLPLIICLLKHV